MDMSDMKLDTSQIQQVFGEDAMKQIMSGAPQFSFDEAFGEGDFEIPEEQRQQMEEAGNQLASGFMAWLAVTGKLVPGTQPDFSALLQEYLQTEEAQAILAPLGESLSGEAERMVNQAMTNYMTNQFAPYLSQALTSMMEQAAQLMAAQLAQQMAAQMAAASGKVGSAIGQAISSQLSGQMDKLSEALQNGFSVDADAFTRAIQFNMTQEDLTSLLTNYMNADELTYEGNLSKLGYARPDSPESISIYPKDFEAKEAVLGIVDGYNERLTAEGKDDSTIQYSDIAGVLMSSVTDIVNTISLVLIAFVSISLVVSSIMISIITYISVLERKKEIGILRAMGASKLNVANIFNAETVIEGFFAGVLAIAVVYAASVPVNEIVYRLKDVPNIMQLRPENALALVVVSVVLTLVAGLIPSSAAARRDPVEALRSE
jgi:ABC-type antimicrobial peptide transport system permease subunit